MIASAPIPAKSYIDNIIRPSFVSKKTRLSPITAVIGMIGGALLFGVIGIFIGLFSGIVLGMQIQQMMFTASAIEIAEAFNGDVDVDVNFNATEFAEKSKKVLVPAMTHILNNTVVRNFAACKPVSCGFEGDNSNIYCMECNQTK